MSGLRARLTRLERDTAPGPGSDPRPRMGFVLTESEANGRVLGLHREVHGPVYVVGDDADPQAVPDALRQELHPDAKIYGGVDPTRM